MPCLWLKSVVEHIQTFTQPLVPLCDQFNTFCPAFVIQSSSQLAWDSFPNLFKLYMLPWRQVCWSQVHDLLLMRFSSFTFLLFWVAPNWMIKIAIRSTKDDVMIRISSCISNLDWLYHDHQSKMYFWQFFLFVHFPHIFLERHGNQGNLFIKFGRWQCKEWSKSYLGDVPKV